MSKIGKTAKKLLSDDKGFVVAIAIALIIVSYLMLSYYFVYRPIPEGYSTMGMLDYQNKAVDYPEVVVLNQNNTFTINLTVENHMGSSQQYKVLMKTVEPIEVIPVDTPPIATYEKTVADGETWNIQPTVTLNDTGYYSVIFELYRYIPESNNYQFDNYNICVLNVQVISN
ncbi:MAG: DUF1616 domain-containing protein [Candidatus Bathyarchaeota archaeon]|nr:DUF1616 domain-containing protein [Candidatus Bathyarchaeota archaeon]